MTKDLKIKNTSKEEIMLPLDRSFFQTITKNKKESDTDVIHPVIFDGDNPDSPISTPLLSRINFNMMYDANLEVLKSGSKLKCGDEYLNKSMINDLADDQLALIRKTIYNNIVESSIYSFSNYWKYVSTKLLDDVLHVQDEFVDRRDSVVFDFAENIRSKVNEIISYIDPVLLMYKEVTYNTFLGNPINQGVIDDYIYRKSINISQYITSVIVETFQWSLFTYLSNYTVSQIAKKSKIIKDIYDRGYNDASSVTQQLIGYIIYDSLYEFSANCLNQSVANILFSAISSTYTMYSDISLLDGKSIVNPIDIKYN